MVEYLSLGFLYSLVKDGVAVIRRRRQRLSPPDVVEPNITVTGAIDYIVNNSRADLNKPPPPKVDGYGPGTVLYVSGVEHQDARRQLNSRLISGEIRSWGLRQLKTHLPNQFELSHREIPKEYWDDMQLDFQSCLYYKGPYPQTTKIPGRSETYHWADIRLSKVELRQFWKPKAAWTRYYAKILRRPRIAPAKRVDL
jgi:hypothetical protein